MLNTMTMEQINKSLKNSKGVAGKIMNKRQMELNRIEKEVRQEMNNDFKMMARYTQSLTIEDVYGKTNDTVEYVEAEVVGIVGQDIEFTDRKDLVELPSWCMSYSSGIRYTERIESPFVQRMY